MNQEKRERKNNLRNTNTSKIMQVEFADLLSKLQFGSTIRFQKEHDSLF